MKNSTLAHWDYLSDDNLILVSISGYPDDLVEFVSRAERLGFGPNTLALYSPLLPHIASGLVTAVSASGDEEAIYNLRQWFQNHPGMSIYPVCKKPDALLQKAINCHVLELMKNGMESDPKAAEALAMVRKRFKYA